MFAGKPLQISTLSLLVLGNIHGFAATLVETRLQYNGLEQVSQEVITNTNGNSVYQVNYERYDNNSMPLHIVITSNPSANNTISIDENYTYSALQRLNNESEAINSSQNGYSVAGSTYYFDLANNLRQTADQNNVLTTNDYDAFGELTESTSGGTSETFTYDSDHSGNLLGDSTQNQYRYNVLNELSTYTSAQNQTTDYTYLATGDRYSKTLPNEPVVQLYYADGTLINEAAAGTMSSYLLGPQRGARFYNGVASLYLYDGNASVVGTMTPNGMVLSYSQYQAYGKTLSAASSAQSPTDANPISQDPFAWSSMYLDSESGLYNDNAREYDPEFGRFLQTDYPLGLNQAGLPRNIKDSQSLSTFAYGAGNPLMDHDTNGHFIGLLLGLAAGVAEITADTLAAEAATEVTATIAEGDLDAVAGGGKFDELIKKIGFGSRTEESLELSSDEAKAAESFKTNYKPSLMQDSSGNRSLSMRVNKSSSMGFNENLKTLQRSDTNQTEITLQALKNKMKVGPSSVAAPATEATAAAQHPDLFSWENLKQHLFGQIFMAPMIASGYIQQGIDKHRTTEAEELQLDTEQSQAGIYQGNEGIQGSTYVPFAPSI